MKTILAFPFLCLPALAQAPIDATNPGQRLPASTQVSLSFGSASGAVDDFNRPNSTNMGPDWTERLGDLNIAANAAQGTSGVSWMTHNSVGTTYVDSVSSADFLPRVAGPGLIFVALTIGDETSSSAQIFVKVQDNNSDGLYDRIWFYNGVNGSSWGTSNAAGLAAPVTSGRMQLTFTPDGDTAILDLDYNFDGIWDEQFTNTGVLATFPGLGQDFGVSTYNDPDVDNWAVNSIPVDPGSPYCFGDSTGASCPCSAFGGLGEGCANTSGSGAVLIGSGNAAFSGDSFQLDVTGVPGDKPGLVLRGDSQVAIPAGDGILCNTGGSMRSHVQVTSMGVTTFTDFNGAPFGSVANTGGVATNFQFWYRDPSNTCSGAGFNFTNGWTVTFLP